MARVAATLSPAQSAQLMALGVMVRDSELRIEGRMATEATELLVDISQEIALQMGAEGEKPDGR